MALLKKTGAGIDDWKRRHQTGYTSTMTGAEHQIQKRTSGACRSSGDGNYIMSRNYCVVWSQIRNPCEDKMSRRDPGHGTINTCNTTRVHGW